MLQYVETDGRTPKQDDIIKGRDLIPGEVHAIKGDTGNKCGSVVSRINQIYLGKRIEYGFVTYSGELLYINIDVDWGFKQGKIDLFEVPGWRERRDWKQRKEKKSKS